jgi:hypothetical protein
MSICQWTLLHNIKLLHCGQKKSPLDGVDDSALGFKQCLLMFFILPVLHLTKYMVMSRDQNAGPNGYIQIGNKLKLWNSLNIWEQP